jgi:pyrophosphate--fructose-6-phosphate 1-phosphotransferase
LQVQQLISELNEILAHDIVDEGGLWKKKLEFLPQAIQEQLMLERDPHGNVQVFVSYILLVLFMIFD